MNKREVKAGLWNVVLVVTWLFFVPYQGQIICTSTNTFCWIKIRDVIDAWLKIVGFKSRFLVGFNKFRDDVRATWWLFVNCKSIKLIESRCFLISSLKLNRMLKLKFVILKICSKAAYNNITNKNDWIMKVFLNVLIFYIPKRIRNLHTFSKPMQRTPIHNLSLVILCNKNWNCKKFAIMKY